MKSFFAATLIGAAVANPLPFTIPDVSTLTTIQYNEMVAGVFYGAMAQKGEVHIESCLMDAEAEAMMVHQVFEDYKIGDYRQATSDMETLVHALGNLKLACSPAVLAPDIYDLEQWALFFERPKAIVVADVSKNWLLHSIAMTKDMNHATTFWNAGQFFQFGEEVGTMAVILSQ